MSVDVGFTRNWIHAYLFIEFPASRDEIKRTGTLKVIAKQKRINVSTSTSTFVWDGIISILEKDLKAKSMRRILTHTLMNDFS